MRVTNLGASADGATGAVWGTADVLVKPSDLHPNVVANEYVANRLALVLGVPVPMGDVWTDELGVKYWVTAAIRQRGFELPPPTSADLAQVPEDMRSLMLIFDAWINNVDRHEENILCDRRGRAWLIDHDQALYGDIRSDRTRGLLSTMDRPLTGHIFATPGVRPGAGAIDAAIWRLRTVEMRNVKAQLKRAQDARLINHQEVHGLWRFLSDRRGNIQTLLPRGIGVSNNNGARQTVANFDATKGEQGAR